ncbi:hypothetical protein GCM10007973_25880 [Polymorphobacter multimanifer]|nr:hypothetical protein GCM10007973_25880 [Polymorphobacter multimanifer]
MGEAIAKGQPALGGADDIILAKIGNGIGERPVEIEATFIGELQDHRRGGDDLGEGRQIEPVLERERLGDRFALCKACQARRPPAIGHDHAENGAREAPRRNRLAGSAEAGVGDLLDHAATSDGRGRTRAMTGRNSRAARLSPPESRKKLS